jgi:excisionase family DNA binding protein
MEEMNEWNYQEEELLKPSEVAHLLKISKSMSYRLMQTGKIPYIRINRSVRIAPDDLRKYIEGQRVA